MSADRYGWCPSIATPMAAVDGLLVRVKPPASTIPAAAARAIADAAARCGNGAIDLTSRSNLQFRGLSADTAGDFAATVRDCGLAAADDAVEVIRNIAADPLGGDDPDAAIDSHALALALEAMLAGDTRLRGLPPKFGIIVDCGRTLPIPDASADIMLRADDGSLAVTFDGGAGSLPVMPDEAPDVARRLALAFLALAGPPDRPHRIAHRMRDLVTAIGDEAVLEAAGMGQDARVKGDARVTPGHDVGVFARAVPGPAPPFATPFTSCPGSTRASPDPSGPATPVRLYTPPPAGSPVGFVRYGTRDFGAFVVGAPGGRIASSALSVLADLATRFGDGTLRTTPWRALVLPAIRPRDVASLAETALRLGLIVDAADPRRLLHGPASQARLAPNARPETTSR